MKLFTIVAALCFTSCDRELPSESQQSQVLSEADDSLAELPESLEALVSGIIDAMPEERKTEIKKAESAELMADHDHFGIGMALRNGELNQRGSEVTGYLTRRGIHHPDDFSGIIILSVNRRLRGEPIDLDGQIQHYRSFHAKRDVVAPLDTACPTCGTEMEINYSGGDMPGQHPDRVYFRGQCTTEHTFLYYHTDGWRTEEDVWSGSKQQGEQVEASDRAPR